MVEEPSHMKQLSLNHVCKIGLRPESIYKKHFKNFFWRWAGPRPHIPFPPDLLLYVNLVICM